MLIAMILISGCAANNGMGVVEICESNDVAVSSDDNVATTSSLEDDAQYDQFIIKFKNEGQQLAPSGNAIREYRVSGISMNVIADKTYSFELPRSLQEKTEILQQLKEREDVEYVEPDYPIFQIEGQEENNFAMTSAEDDSIGETASTLWSHQATQVEQAWQYTRGSKNVVVAVVDSGIDYTHKDLKANIWVNSKETINGKDDDGNGYIDDMHGWNFVGKNADIRTNPKSNHGTHVAGTIGATGEGGRGVIGMSPNVKMMGLRFIGDTGSGATSNAIKSIDYAVSKKVFAINNSWGSSGYSKALSEAITRAEKAGVLFVVAAGNGYKGKGFDIGQDPWYPAAYKNSNILNVAASTAKDKLTTFSNFSKSQVDVAAPGLSILSTVSNQGYQTMSGTSMAAPLVTGLAALVKSANMALDYKQVKAIIRSSVDNISAMNMLIFSGGRVNALKAVRIASETVNSEVVVRTCE